jgi:hypothetical protein
VRSSVDDGSLSRAGQGYPAKIENEAILDAAAALLAGVLADWVEEREQEARARAG